MLEHLSFRRRIIVSFSILILLPSALLLFFVQLRATAAIRSTITKSAVDTIGLVAKETESRLNGILESNERVFLDSRVLRALSRDSSGYSVAQQMDDLDYLRWFLRSAEASNRDIYRIRLFVPAGRIYSNEKINIFNMEKISLYPWLSNLENTRTNVLYDPNHKYVDHDDPLPIVSFARRITTIERFGETVGIVAGDVLVQTLEDLISRALVGGSGEVTLSDSGGTQFARVSNLTETPPSDWQASGSPASADVHVLQSGNWIRLSSRVKPYDIYVTATIPLDRWIRPSAMWNLEVALVAVLVTVAAILVAGRLTRYDISRIQSLARSMSAAHDTEPEPIEVVGSDEITQLHREFNSLVHRLRLSRRAEFRAGLEAKSAELEALQSQINPHFLYNTLDLLKWYAGTGNTAQIEATVDLLSAFYRRSLRAGESVVTVADELEHVDAYVQIQNFRFGNAITFGIYVPELVRQQQIVRLTLQPLVENAILHGIMEKPGSAGSVVVTGRMVGGDVEISVRDDGVGMDEEQLKTILSGSTTATGSGFGIHNVDARLKLTFGDAYGLSYSAAPGAGTTVRILVPQRQHNDKDVYARDARYSAGF